MTTSSIHQDIHHRLCKNNLIFKYIQLPKSSKGIIKNIKDHDISLAQISAKSIRISYRMLLSAIWDIFFEFFLFPTYCTSRRRVQYRKQNEREKYIPYCTNLLRGNLIQNLNSKYLRGGYVWDYVCTG